MSNERNIRRGGLFEKMGSYAPAPPESVWKEIASGLRGKRSNRKLFIFLGAAAGLALAISVGIALYFNLGQPGIAVLDEAVSEESPAAIAEDSPPVITPDSTPGSPGNGGRLEQKVIAAMDEVMAEQEAVQLSVNHLQPVPGTLRISTEGDSGQPMPGDTGQSVSENIEQSLSAAEKEVQDQITEQSEGSTFQQDTVTNAEQREKSTVENRPQAVNEDSLVSLMQGKDPDIVSAKKKRSGKWQLGATLSPLISYRDASSAVEAQNVAVNNSESARLTYAGGLQVSYFPTERLAIQTGVYYNKMGVNIGDYSNFKSGWLESSTDMVNAPTRTENVVSISNSMGTVVSSDKSLYVNNYADGQTLTDYHTLTPEAMSIADAYVEGFSQTLEYLEIPFNVRYKVFDRTIGLHLLGGFSANLLVSNSISAIAGDEAVTIGEVRDIRTFNYSGNAGLGMVYDVFKNFSLSIEPRFRYYLNSVNADHLPVTRPYTFGFYTGVNYKF